MTDPWTLPLLCRPQFTIGSFWSINLRVSVGYKNLLTGTFWNGHEGTWKPWTETARILKISLRLRGIIVLVVVIVFMSWTDSSLLAQNTKNSKRRQKEHHGGSGGTCVRRLFRVNFSWDMRCFCLASDLHEISERTRWA